MNENNEHIIEGITVEDLRKKEYQDKIFETLNRIYDKAPVEDREVVVRLINHFIAIKKAEVKLKDKIQKLKEHKLY